MTMRPSELSKAADISIAYASQILGGSRVPPRATALRIFRTTGARFGDLVGASDAEIAILERFEAPGAQQATA